MAKPPSPDGASSEAGQERRTPRIRYLVALLVLLGAFRLLFPGDVPFVNDEPVLIENALDANEAGELVPAGLMGTRGTRYGPVPTWFYQISLSVTSDLRWVVLARIILITALTALALVLLSRNLDGLTPVLGAFAFLSPYLWFYARDLWDNSFSIPFTAMLLAAYAQFCRDGRVRSLALVGFFGTLCFMTHLMTLPLVAAVGLHFGATRWRTMLQSRRFALGVVLVLAACLALAFPYLREISGGSAAGFRFYPSFRPLVFSLNGMRLFSLVGFDYFIGPWRLGGLGLVATLVSLFSYVAWAYGLYLWVVEIRDGEGDSLHRQMGTVLLLTLALFVVVVNGERLRGHPHYYSGVWIVFFCFWWKGMSRLVLEAWPRRVFLAQVTVMAVFLLGVPSWVHWNRGSKMLHHGPTLENQMDVARELDRLGLDVAQPSPAHHPRLFPHAIGVLRRLNERDGGTVAAPTTPGTGVVIVYTDPEGGRGEIVLGEIRPPEGDPLP